MRQAVFCHTVEAIVQETGVKPNTVRHVLRQASVKGEIVLKRMANGKRNHRLVVAEKEPDGAILLEQIFFGVSNGSKTDS